MSEHSSDEAGYLAQLLKRVSAATGISLSDKNTLATIVRTGTIAAATAFALRLLLSSGSKATADPTVLPPHPGTAEARQNCDNPAVAPDEFEQRFVATAARLQDQTFDFIVVGAGSAGCVAARRLSMDPNVSVLLVECGGEAQNAANVRSATKIFSLIRSEVDWGLVSTPQPQLGGRVIPLDRGKTLGGTSALNWHMWVRGAPQDFDRWADECGCGPEWSYRNVVQNFQNLERLSDKTSTVRHRAPEEPSGVDYEVRGANGSLTPNVVFPPLKEIDAFIEACAANDIKPTVDYNGADQYGVGYTQQSTNINNGRRNDAFTCFVEPIIRERPNLHIASEAMCLKVLFSPDKRAKGVRLQLPTGRAIDVLCNKEVVLCAGAIHSPQLLLLSGVGDATHLREHGIPVVADIPAVGLHLQDHPGFALFGHVREDVVEEDYKNKRAGTGGLNGVAFFKTDEDRRRDAERGSDSGPDAELVALTRLNSTLVVRNIPNVVMHIPGAVGNTTFFVR